MRWRAKIALALVLPFIIGLAIVAIAFFHQSDPGAAHRIDLHQLRADPDAYYGRLITTSGAIRVYTTAPHGPYAALESPTGDFVGLLGIAWNSLAACAGATAEVTGTFNFSPTFGLHLQVSSIRISHPPTGCQANPPATPGGKVPGRSTAYAATQIGRSRDRQPT